jgi:hypothetical protein
VLKNSRSLGGGAGAGQAGGEAAFARRRAGDQMGAPAPGMVMVFRDIGEDGEIAEGAGDLVDLFFRKAGEDFLQLGLRGEILVAVETNGELADKLDLAVGFLAVKGADGFTQDAAEQADIVAQGVVRGFNAAVLGVSCVHAASNHGFAAAQTVFCGALLRQIAG